MIHERKKVAKIVEELTIFFFSMGATKMSSDIAYDGATGNITFRSNFHPENKEHIAELEKYFNAPKNEGMEDIYWELAGSGDPGETSQLLLLGMMVDRAELHLMDTEVELKLYKELIKGQSYR